ncbi:MAG: efflux RND transporter periplasmic adaptor subunit [Gemmatimonadota bacterium]|nr:efflux RND transporter periplasmic adaptor subunit [Gemmatimonadota bacterium]
MDHITIRGATAMKGFGLRFLAGALVVGAAAGCGSDAQADGAQETGEASFTRVINVEVEEVALEDFVEEIRVTGVAQANQDVTVSAEESGVIRAILAEKGAFVSEGQPLLKIDDGVLRAQVDQARAQAELAAQTWERRKRLWEEDGVGSEIAYLEAKFSAEQSAANLAGLERRLERTTVRAPFDGIFDERSVEVGSMVSPGQAVGRVVALSTVKVEAGVPERYAPDVSPGSNATVRFDVLPGEQFPATIEFVGSSVDPRNRTFPIEIVMENPRRVVKPEMVANVVVQRRSFSDVVVVPQDALVRVEDGYVLFVAEEADGDGPRARTRQVELGPSQNNRVVVESGLEPGDRLIVVGQRSVAGGDRINVVGP